jgi:hypothetical protein
MTVFPASSARLTSRATCSEAPVCSETTTTMAGQVATAAKIWSTQDLVPVRLSGAIQVP